MGFTKAGGVAGVRDVDPLGARALVAPLLGSLASRMLQRSSCRAGAGAGVGSLADLQNLVKLEPPNLAVMRMTGVLGVFQAPRRPLVVADTFLESWADRERAGRAVNRATKLGLALISEEGGRERRGDNREDAVTLNYLELP